MSILVNNDTRLAVAGITGREGSFHTLNNRAYGTNVVGGINPKKAGENVEGIPVFANWADTVAETQAWCHLDVYSWNDGEKPGRPRGGEAQGLRAYFSFLLNRFRSGVTSHEDGR